ncbi:hypothetical protein P20429_1764 [Pseudoalteromonas sp. BSi20429]|nr:hypothetical protein P20429_1764 [Pseudoalteromonas sp. BSi20429]
MNLLLLLCICSFFIFSNLKQTVTITTRLGKFYKESKNA